MIELRSINELLKLNNIFDKYSYSLGMEIVSSVYLIEKQCVEQYGENQNYAKVFLIDDENDALELTRRYPILKEPDYLWELQKDYEDDYMLYLFNISDNESILIVGKKCLLTK